MTFQGKLIILFFILTIQVSAQKLAFIRDINLRKELNKQGFITNDSLLDIRKIYGRLQLNLANKGIENIDGLEYFKQLSGLSINGNKIKLLANLPRSLTYLDCSNNEITLIDSLPISLKQLKCSNNKISSIKNLPPYLTSLDFNTNLMETIPQLPKTLQYINYSHNPILTDSLPVLFRRISCDDHSQNCLPYELMNWRILNVALKDTPLKIIGMTVKLNSTYSWGFGSQTETINYSVKESKLIADKIEVNRMYNKKAHPDSKDSFYYYKIKYSVEVPKINQLIEDIYSNKMIVEIQVGDSIESIDLRNKKNGTTCMSGCDDCTGYSLQYLIYCQSDTIKLEYQFDTGMQTGVTICSTNGPENIKSILDWLYIYKLTNLTLDKHEVTTYFFTKNNLDKIIKWSK